MAYTPENNPYIPGDPYSYDLKWIVRKINEWTGKYNSVEEAISKLETDFEDLKNYVIDYLETTDFEGLVDDKLQQMLENGDFETVFEEYVVPKINELIQVYKSIPNFIPSMNVVKTIFRGMVDNVSGYASGACYLQNNECAIAFDSAISNNTIIAVYDISTWALLREQTLEVRHANTLTYNPTTNKIYVGGNASYDKVFARLEEKNKA